MKTFIPIAWVFSVWLAGAISVKTLQTKSSSNLEPKWPEEAVGKISERIVAHEVSYNSIEEQRLATMSARKRISNRLEFLLLDLKDFIVDGKFEFRSFEASSRNLLKIIADTEFYIDSEMLSNESLRRKLGFVKSLFRFMAEATEKLKRFSMNASFGHDLVSQMVELSVRASILKNVEGGSQIHYNQAFEDELLAIYCTLYFLIEKFKQGSNYSSSTRVFVKNGKMTYKILENLRLRFGIQSIYPESCQAMKEQG